MTTVQQARFRRLRRAGGVSLALLLASCIHVPSVAPTATLVGRGEPGAGPRTLGGFSVVYAAPKGEVTDRRAPAITVLFSRGMRSLDTAEDQGLPRVDVRTKEGAVVAGKLTWVGTRGLLFVPEKELPGATGFSVTVPAGTSTLDGAALTQDYAFEFTTPKPLVVRAYPAPNTSSLRPDSPFSIAFNQDVAPEAIEKAAHLVAHGADGDAGEPIAFHATRAKDDYRGADPHRILIKADRPLPLDRTIALGIDAGLRGTEGPAEMAKPFSLSARTYGPLRLESFHCARIAAEGRCRAHADVKVSLSNPVSPDELRSHLKAPGLLAKPPKRAPGAKAPDSFPSATLGLAADPQLGKKYKVTLTAGMKDVFGQALAQDASFELEVEAPFVGPKRTKPGAAGAKPHAKAAAPQPVAGAGPQRPKLPYDLQLGLAGGGVVEALATTGVKSHLVPVGSVNIPTYALGTNRLTEPQTLAWLAGPQRQEFFQRNGFSMQFILPDAPESTRAVRGIDLDALLGKTARGAALLSLEIPGESWAREELVRVTDLGVTAKASHYGSLVWVTSLATGKPVAGATVSVRSPDKGEVLVARTDDQGLAEIPAASFDPFADARAEKDPKIATRGAVVFVRSGDDWTYQALQRSATDQRLASAYQNFNERSEMLGIVYTDRGVYRPGETVKVAGIVRTLTPTGLEPSAADEVRLEAHDGNGATVLSTRTKLDAFGAFATDVLVPKSAHLGDARVVATVRAKGHLSTELTGSFKLAAYKASEFKVSVEPSAKAYVRGDDALFTIKGEYLFGGPMAGVAAHTAAQRAQSSFTPPGAGGLALTDEARAAEQPEVAERVTELGASDEKLDATGTATRTLRLAMPGQSGPEQVTLEAEVEDVSRQTVARRASAVVHPAEFYLGLARPKERFVTVGDPLHAEVTALEPTGAHRPGVAVKVELFNRKWIGAVEEHADGTGHKVAHLVDEPAGSCDVRTDVQARGCDLKIPEAGYYVLRATGQDPRGNPVRVSETFYGVEPLSRPSPPIAWAETDSRAVKLETGKKTYDLGETARVLVRSPFREADALVTVERAGLLSRRVVHLTGPMPIVEIPVTPELYPNAYVAVQLVRGRVAAPPEQGVDLGGPEFRLGYAELTVNPDAHRLAVTVTPGKTDYRPGDEVDVDVTVAEHDGKPAESELTFFAVDEGVLMLTGYATPDPLPAFARKRGLAMFNVESREALARLLPMHAGDKLPIVGFELQPETTASGDKGYPGGGGAGAMRADFKSTAYFEAGKVTGKEGKAHLHFKLPDNLTTFRLMTVAAGAKDFFGSGDAKITTSKKLMARPALPRFVRVGDAFDASVVVSSKELGDAEVTVALDAHGLDVKGDRTRKVHLGKGGSVEVRFPVVATALGEARVEFALSAGGEADRVRVTRKVDLPLSTETASAYGETETAAAVALGDLSGLRGDTGELRVRLAPTALVGLASSMEKLLDYPYGCTEQLTSRLLPLVALGDLAKDLGVRLPANVPRAVDEATDAILENQRDDGGFGFWKDSEESVPWLSAYVVTTLEAVKKAGHEVRPGELDQAVQYLRSALGRTRLVEQDPDAADAPKAADAPAPALVHGRKPEDLARVDYANAAFLADALATIGAPDPGYLTRLFDARRGKPLSARALVLHGMVAAKMSAAPAGILAKELEGELAVDAASAVAPPEDDAGDRELLESQSRTTALVLRGLLAADPKSAIASRVARGLLGLRTRGGWPTTQDNGWALTALRDYRAAQETSAKTFEARAFLGGDLLADATFHGTADHEVTVTATAARAAAATGPVAFEVRGEGKVFYAAELRYATTTLPKEARDQGLFVKKLVRALRPEGLEEAASWIPRKSAESATAGDLVLIDLLVESSEERHQVVIDDPLPAGLEAVDTAMDTSSKRTVADDDGRRTGRKATHPDALTGIGAAFRPAHVHREFHDDRVLTFVEDLPPGMYHFRYLARATSIGTFIVPPTRVDAMYSPEIWGSTPATAFEVRAAP